MYRKAFIALGLMLGSVPAHAISTINNNVVSLDPSAPFSWNIFLQATVKNDQGESPSGVTAHAIFNYLGHDAANKVFSFSYWIDNTSVAPSQNSRLGSVGFNISPGPNSAADPDNSNVFKLLQNGGNFNGLGTRTVCLYAGNNCNGGANDGLTPGATPDEGTFTITYNNAQTGFLTFSNFVGRWQATDIGSTSGGPTGGGGGVTPIPEAATWAMMLIGFGAMGGALRRRRAQTARLQAA